MVNNELGKLCKKYKKEYDNLVEGNKDKPNYDRWYGFNFTKFWSIKSSEAYVPKLSKIIHKNKTKCKKQDSVKRPDWKGSAEWLLHKICGNTGFHWPVFFRIRTKSTILSFYWRIRVTENPHSRIFYAEWLWR